MSVPFPEAQLEPLIYMSLGALVTLVIILSFYIRKLHGRLEDGTETEDEKEKIRVDNIGLSRRAKELIEIVMEAPEMQSDLPSKMDVSKATVSNSVSELKERNLIKRKKRGNTYLVEPKMEKLKEQQR